MKSVKWLRELGLWLAGGMLAAVAGYLALTAVRAIPVRHIDKNIRVSADIFAREGDQPSLYIKGAFLENFSDADAFGVTFNEKSPNPFRNALYAYNYYTGKEGSSRGVTALAAGVSGRVEKDAVYEHSQEWHGFQVWLRPLLVFYSLPDIRFLGFLTVQFLLVLACGEWVRVSKDRWGFVPFLISFEFFCYTLEALSVLFFADIGVMLAGCWCVLRGVRLHKERIWFCRLFALTGAAASYFSMFNMPLLTVGFPLAAWLGASARREENASVMYRQGNVFLGAGSWLAGYAFMTFLKIGLTILFFQAANGVFAVKWYAGITGGISWAERLFRLQGVLLSVYARGDLGRHLLFLFLAAVLICAAARGKFRRSDWEGLLPYLTVAAFPAVWVVALPVHAQMPWTPFLFGVSVYAVLQAAWNICRR